MSGWLNKKRFKQLWYGCLCLVSCLLVLLGQYAHGAEGTVFSTSASEPISSESISSESISVVTPSVLANEEMLLAAEGVNDSQVGDYLDQGQVLYDAGRYIDAIATWNQALTLTQNAPSQNNLSQQAIAHNYLAIAHQALSQWNIAEGHIQQGLYLLTKVPSSAFVTAQLLNTRGSTQLQTGDATAALDTWQAAIELYESLDSTETILALVRTRINQAQALRVLGFYRRAQITLDEVRSELNDSAVPPEMALAVLQSLGQILVRTGDLNQAQAVLNEALLLANTPSQQAVVKLSLAQTTAALGDTQTALDFYQQAKRQGTSNIQIEAALNQLALELETTTSSSTSLSATWPAISQEIAQLLPQLSALPPSRWGINAQVYMANLLIDAVGSSQQWASLDLSPQEISQQLVRAVHQARSLQDSQAEATALGELGHLYEQNQQWDAALELTQQALALMPSARANYANAQWQWQLGRIFQAQGLSVQAIANYGSAVSQLDVLQYEIVALNPDAKFSFRKRIEPVYRSYVGLLLADVDQQPDAVQQQRLKQARDAMEALQIAELQNYFRETCLTYQTREIESIDPQAAVVYPMVLNKRLDVIVALPHQPLQHHSVSLDMIDQEGFLRGLLSSLHPISPVNAVLPFGQQLYDWLIAPIAPQLQQQKIETLVFVPDGFLRNIPMAILHDGSHFLVEQFSLALTPSMKLFNSQSLESGALNVLTAGLTQGRQGFSALPAVDREINQIGQLVSTNVLLNDRFTNEHILERFEKNKFSIVHLATHGTFSASAADTFLLTWNNRINVKDLGELFQTSQSRDSPIELLVLSACQTAQGDLRAALGMAGVAVESGARSTVATLWRVQDESTASFMGEFYQRLIDSQQSRAQALRESQLMLMQDPNYRHPYYWAPFVMIGNWQ